MTVEKRTWIGLIFILCGIVIQPIGWMFEFWLQVLSFALIFLGAIILVTQRYMEKSVEREYASSGKDKKAMPGDVHDYSGWGRRKKRKLDVRFGQ